VTKVWRARSRITLTYLDALQCDIRRTCRYLQLSGTQGEPHEADGESVADNGRFLLITGDLLR
jgi:hypothetical protein